MSPLPEWTQEGAIIGLEGGSEIVESSMDKLVKAGVQMVGLWLQDWSGLHHAYDGDRLLWDWKLSEEQVRMLGWGRGKRTTTRHYELIH